MRDHFFEARNCDRCGGLLTVRRMSRFNTQVLCPKCIEDERQHPNYKLAADAELAAVKRGGRNFTGIGWPGKNGRIKNG